LIIAQEVETQKALVERICLTERLEAIRDFNKNNQIVNLQLKRMKN
jgi:hypothetical protein